MREMTNEELIEKVLQRIQFPDTGKKSDVKKNLMYVRTALGGTFIEVEEEESK